MFDLMPIATSVTSRQSCLAPVACARLTSTVGRTYTVNDVLLWSGCPKRQIISLTVYLICQRRVSMRAARSHSWPNNLGCFLQLWGWNLRFSLDITPQCRRSAEDWRIFHRQTVGWREMIAFYGYLNPTISHIENNSSGHLA
jgi:hypothetical protein